MTQPIQTHINAYYSDLITAKQEAAAANQRVIELEEAIRARGGEVPGENSPKVEVVPPQEDIASSDDMSAAEKSSKDNKSKRDER